MPTPRVVAVLALALLTAAPTWSQPTNDDELPFVERNGEKIALFMHTGTFADDSGSGWARDEVELEAAMTVSCIPFAQLYEVLQGDEQRNFRQLRRVPDLEGYSSGYPLDEMPWDEDAHAVREGRLLDGEGESIDAWVWLSIEPGRFDVDPERGVRRLDLGTDIMEDVYYDTDEFLLLQNGMSLRTRRRWDNSTDIRRLLIALKIETGFDELGIKGAVKTDVRSNESPSREAVEGLEEEVLRGLESWSMRPALPLRRAYEHLSVRGLLTDTQSYQDVLVLKPKLFVRSRRSRYHLNETSTDEIRRIHELGTQRVESLVTMAREAREDPGALRPLS